MLIVTPEKTIKEGQDLLVELRKKGITNHLKLASDTTLKEKVEGFIKDVRTALTKVQGGIRNEIDKPAAAYSEGRMKGLRAKERILINTQDELLRLVTEKR